MAESEYDRLVADFVATIMSQPVTHGSAYYGYSGAMVEDKDWRKEPFTRIERSGFMDMRRTPVTVQPTVSTTFSFVCALKMLERCLDTVGALSLPPESPIRDQVTRTMNKLCELSEVLSMSHKTQENARGNPLHKQGVEMAAQVLAVVHLAKAREDVLHAIDPATIRRTAQALTQDLAAAREHLTHSDPFDREMAALAKGPVRQTLLGRLTAR